MSPSRSTFRWSPASARSATRGGEGRSLAELLGPLVGDRASSALELVREASEALLDWLAEEEGAEAAWDELAGLLEAELVAFDESQGWRGPVAHWLATLRRLLALGRAGSFDAPAREVLAEELGLWLDGEGAGSGPWDGAPLAPGRRSPDRARCAETAAAAVERGEVILTHGWSDTVALALEEVHARGLDPEIVLAEGGADLAGRRMARRLVSRGAKVRVVYDAALVDAVVRADRVWLGTEAIGAEALLARVGTRAMLAEARRLEVPSTVVATSDKLLPGGELRLPAWCERAAWLLWERAPEGVRVDSQMFERVPLDLPDRFATEHGSCGPADVSLLALRTDG